MARSLAKKLQHALARLTQRCSNDRNTGVFWKTSRPGGLERIRDQFRSLHPDPGCISDTRCRRTHHPGRTPLSAGGDQAEARLLSDPLGVGVKADTNHDIGRAANPSSVHYPWAQVYQDVFLNFLITAVPGGVGPFIALSSPVAPSSGISLATIGLRSTSPRSIMPRSEGYFHDGIPRVP